MARARGVEGPSLSLDRAKRNPTRPPPRWICRELGVARKADEPARPPREYPLAEGDPKGALAGVLNDYTAKVWTSLAERRADIHRPKVAAEGGR